MFFQNSSKEYIFSLISESLAQYLEAMKEMGERRRIPNISWNTARFFIETFRQYSITNILEIGPANWFSTMILALASPHAHITTLECSRHAFEELRYNIQTFISIKNAEWKMQNDGIFSSPADMPRQTTSDVDQSIIGQCNLFFWDARQILPAFESGASEIHCSDPESYLTNIPKHRFECVFIDGAFRMTRDFFDLSYPLLLPGGVMIIDDVIKYRWKMDGFHEYLENQGITYEIVQTDEDDGVMLIKKMISETKVL